MKAILPLIRSNLAALWKGLQIYDKKPTIKINSESEAIERKKQVESILKEYKLDKVKVEFVFDPKKGAEFTLRGEVSATKENLKTYDNALEKISAIGLTFFFSQELIGGRLVLRPLFPYGFGKKQTVVY